jgi:hypothetical protein
MSALLQRWSHLRRELGAGVALLLLVHRLLTRATRGKAGVFAYRLYGQPIGRGHFDSVRDDAALLVTRVTIEHPLVNDFPRPPQVVKGRFSDGATCYCAELRGRFAGYIWISRQCYEEDEVRCTYVLGDARRCVWDFDVFVVPALRMGRTLARLWKHVDAELAAEGIFWSLSRISAFNRGSSGAHARMGAIEVGRVCFVVVGPAQLALLNRPPYVHLSLVASNRISILVPSPGSWPKEGSAT